MRYRPCLLGLITMCLAGSAVFAEDEAIDEQQQLFESLDADGNGRLSAAEIPEPQSRFFRRVVRVGDEDGDDELTRQEFFNATQERDERVTQPDSQGGDRRPQRGGTPIQFLAIGQLFERFDANGDDKLTLEEIGDDARLRLEPLFRQIGSDEITREQLVEVRDRYFNSPQVVGMLRRLDADGNDDGRLTASEVPEPFRPRLQPLFERFGDELDLQNIAEAMQSRAGDPAQTRSAAGGRTPALLRLLDNDGDNQISREELENAADKFDQLDRNSDGNIDARELFGSPPDGVRPEGRPARDSQPPERATDRPRRPDSGDDNTRDARSPRDRPETSAAGTSGGGPQRTLLSQFDTDGDNALSADEAPRFLKPRFSEVDSDGDGLITGEEIRSIRGGVRPRSQPE